MKAGRDHWKIALSAAVAEATPADPRHAAAPPRLSGTRLGEAVLGALFVWWSAGSAGGQLMPPDPPDLTLREPRLTATSNGGFVLVFQSYRTGDEAYSIRAQKLDSEGLPSGEEIVIAERHTLPVFRALEPSIAVAPLAESGFAVAWAEGASDPCIRVRTYSVEGLLVRELEPVACEADTVFGPSLAALDSGELALLFLREQALDNPEVSPEGTGTAVELRLYDGDGQRVGERDQIVVEGDASPAGSLRWAAVASTGSYGFVTLWAQQEHSLADVDHFLQRFAPPGGRYGPIRSLPGSRTSVTLDGLVNGTVLVAHIPEHRGARDRVVLSRIAANDAVRQGGAERLFFPREPAVAATPRGGAVVVWSEGMGVRAQAFNENVAPQGPPRDLEPSGGDQLRKAVAVSSTGRVVVAWETPALFDIGIVFTGFELPSGCVPSPTTACLNGSQFAVSTSWHLGSSESQAGIVAGRGISDDSVGFSFFGPENWEVLVKVLDGCGFNGHFWVLASAATDVGYVIEVRRDDQTWTHENPLGVLAQAVADTRAFRCSPWPGLAGAGSAEPLETATGRFGAVAGLRQAATPAPAPDPDRQSGPPPSPAPPTV